jgi:hypothetical protein
VRSCRDLHGILDRARPPLRAWAIARRGGKEIHEGRLEIKTEW